MSAAVLPLPRAAVRPAPRFTRLPFYLAVTLIGILAGIQTEPRPSSAGLTISEHDGQLRIAWDPSILAGSENRIDIRDGISVATIPILGGLSGLTYTCRSGDVEVRLIAGRREHAARYVSYEDTAAELSTDLKNLANRARSVRISTESGLWHLAQLQFMADRLMDRATAIEQLRSLR